MIAEFLIIRCEAEQHRFREEHEGAPPLAGLAKGGDFAGLPQEGAAIPSRWQIPRTVPRFSVVVRELARR
jgi:hypothetical protein